jgi:hypothetical protein
MTLPGLVRSVVASFSIPMRLTGCPKISASSDGVKFFRCMLIWDLNVSFEKCTVREKSSGRPPNEIGDRRKPGSK